jgi:hypothetical protein
VDVTVARSSPIEAQRVAQQVLATFQSLANSRLGQPGGGAAVAVWDPPSGGVTKEGKPFAAYGVAGASLGLLASLVATLVLGRRRTGAPAETPRPEPVPVPVRPGRSPKPVSEPEPLPEPERPPAPAPPPEPLPEPLPPRPSGRVRVAELERIAAAEPDARRAEEMHVYIEQLRSLAAPDGTLGASLEPLVEDIFGSLGPP